MEQSTCTRDRDWEQRPAEGVGNDGRDSAQQGHVEWPAVKRGHGAVREGCAEEAPIRVPENSEKLGAAWVSVNVVRGAGRVGRISKNPGKILRQSSYKKMDEVEVSSFKFRRSYFIILVSCNDVRT